MIKIQCLVLCLLGLFILESNSGAVSFIKPCYHDDKSCLLSSAQAAVKYVTKGIPELNVPPADPLFMKSVKSNDQNLKLEFSNLHIAGVSNSKITEISRDVKENTIKVVLETPVHAKGQYVLDGKVFIIHAFGDGDFEIDTDKVIINLLFRIKDIEKGGKKYWKIAGYEYKYILEDKVYIKLHNLFGGDKQKAAPFEKLLDEAWKELVTEIGDQLLQDVIAAFIDVIKKFLLAVPSDELELKKH